MKKRKLIRTGLILALAGVLIGGGTILYLFNMPHRDTQKTKTDYSLTSSALVSEYLGDKAVANKKYLNSDGNSKVLEITGPVISITEDFSGQKVVSLKGENDLAGVSCTFTVESGKNVADLRVGETITVKGVIRSGAAYDEDLGLYENVILDKCDRIKKKL